MKRVLQSMANQDLATVEDVVVVAAEAEVEAATHPAAQPGHQEFRNRRVLSRTPGRYDFHIAPFLLSNPAMEQQQFLSFSELSTPIGTDQCESLLPILDTALRDWELTPTNNPIDNTPVIHLEMTPAGYQRSSPWIGKKSSFTDPVDATCDLIVDLIHAYIAERKNLLCLHCAAVETAGALTIFPTTYRGGKSTLMAKLASLGMQLYSDDVLPVDKSSLYGIALGILPRLRIPLPDDASPEFRTFIDNQSGCKNERYQFLSLDNHQLARTGTTSRINRIIVLELTDDGPSELLEANKGSILRDVILRNFARENTALDILDSLFKIVEQSDCYTLRYSSVDEAGNFLVQQFVT